MGPMFAGKSSEIVHITNRYKSLGWNVCVIGHSSDSRYGQGSQIYTHDNKSVDCIKLDKLKEALLLVTYMNAKVIIIDEAQFFPDLKEFVTLSVECQKKQVYVVGLDGDAERRPFGQILECIPFADTVMKLKSFCKLCGDGTEAIFTRCDRPSEKQKQIHVGGSEMYQPVCRKHFLSLT